MTNFGCILPLLQPQAQTVVFQKKCSIGGNGQQERRGVVGNVNAGLSGTRKNGVQVATLRQLCGRFRLQDLRRVLGLPGTENLEG